MDAVSVVVGVLMTRFPEKDPQLIAATAFQIVNSLERLTAVKDYSQAAAAVGGNPMPGVTP